MKCHPDLTIKRATQISQMRVKALKKSSITKWFNDYVKNMVVNYSMFNPRNIWNADKSNVPIFLNWTNLLVKRGYGTSFANSW